MVLVGRKVAVSLYDGRRITFLELFEQEIQGCLLGFGAVVRGFAVDDAAHVGHVYQFMVEPFTPLLALLSSSNCSTFPDGITT